MSKNSQINVRLDSDKKKKVEKIFADIGLNHASAIDIFYSMIVQYEGLPFNIWKRQFKRKDNYELAKELLELAYKIRNRISYARNPMILPYEQKSEDNKYQSSASMYNLKDKDAQHMEGMQNAYNKRWRDVVECMDKYETKCLEAEVLWGPESPDHLLPLKNCVSKLGRAISQYLTDQIRSLQQSRKFGEAHPPRRSDGYSGSTERVIFEGLDKNDPFKKEVLEAVGKVENLCRNYI